MTYMRIISLVLALFPLQAFAEQIIIFRHALAPGVGDPAEFELSNCQTQRNLSEQGQQQAIAMGDKLREMGIIEAEVFSGEWCRCLETAELLGFGTPQKLTALNSFFHVSNRHLKSQFLADWRAHIVQRGKHKATIYITHQVNISGLLDRFMSSGEGVLIEVNKQGELEIVSVLQ
ncbi:histidine phosphatase family protein [Methylophaga sp.]|uniref:histidine phosphatase family protein n=1 Tax=Methylophaga sp. TaxID=2024840 RepID=UPI00271C7405|nr:histidine phosphatase family protein [Methylophaga sp.]MDO8828310.1 histidine phosphatase family protein [Methylophaga sp.]